MVRCLIAYAMVGDVPAAAESLRKALKTSEIVNDLESIFSVRDYRFVNRDEFKMVTEELLAALERGELWDGTNPNGDFSASMVLQALPGKGAFRTTEGLLSCVRHSRTRMRWGRPLQRFNLLSGKRHLNLTQRRKDAETQGFPNIYEVTLKVKVLFGIKH